MSRSSRIATVLALAAVISMSGCAKKKLSTEQRIPGNPLAANSKTGAKGTNDWMAGAPGAEGANGGFSTSLNGFGNGTMDGGTGGFGQNGNMNGIDGAHEIADLDMVHFDYDQSEIKQEWQTVLDHHAGWLKGNAAVYVQVEGHCDERGTEEYNVALGQRRADSVREYLIGKGIEDFRISTISYGKLRPLSFDQTDTASALNRRAMFLVYSPAETASAY